MNCAWTVMCIDALSDHQITYLYFICTRIHFSCGEFGLIKVHLFDILPAVSSGIFFCLESSSPEIVTQSLCNSFFYSYIWYNFSGRVPVLESPWKWAWYLKVLENGHGPWKSLNLWMKVLESPWVWFSKTPCVNKKNRFSQFLCHTRQTVLWTIPVFWLELIVEECHGALC